MENKKIAVLKWGYEYDDNWYSHDGNIDEKNIKLFNTFDEAEVFRKSESLKAIFEFPTEGDFSNVINDSKIESSILFDVICKHIKTFDRHCSPSCLAKKEITPELWDELYPIIKELYFCIKEIDFVVSDNESKFTWSSEYNNTIFTGIIEADKFILHSHKNPAIISIDNDIELDLKNYNFNKDLDDYELYIKYYIKGKVCESKKDWTNKSRKYRIGDILNK